MLGLSRQPVIQSDPSELIDCVNLLLKAMQKYVVVADTTDAKGFQAELAELENRFGPQGLRGQVNAAIKILEEYAERSNQAIGRQRSELMMVVSDLTRAMASLPEVHKSFELLSALYAQIEAASTASDLDQIKAGMAAGMALAQTEALKQKQQISDVISGTISRMRASQGREASCPPSNGEARYSADPLTGLPGRSYAEAELAKVLMQFPTCQIAAFVVKRLQVINAKFGFRRGDEVLLSVVQYLAQALPDFNSLLRWTPCSFVTIAAPAMIYQEVRRKVQLIDLHRITVTLEWEGRSALVPINLTSQVLSLKEFTSPDQLFQKLDSYAVDL